MERTESGRFDDKISSIQLRVTGEGEVGQAILINRSYFRGNFDQFITTPGQPLTANLSPARDNLAESLMLVRRSPNEVSIPLKDFGIAEKAAELLAQQPRLSPRGTIKVTWDMWLTGTLTGPLVAPFNYEPHPIAPTKKFVLIRVPVTVHVPHWLDYSAELFLWFYLFIDSSGQPNGELAYADAWVAEGLKHDKIRETLRSTLNDNKLKTEVDGMLKPLLSYTDVLAPIRHFYYLPGSRTEKSPSVGSVVNSISIVFPR